MKRMGRKFLLAVFAMFTGLTVANAASKCSYAEQVELNDIAANIKATYEEATQNTGEKLLQEDGTYVDESYTYFKISVFNLSEDLYVKITNDYNTEEKYLKYSDTESGVATYSWTNLDKVTNFKITVYSSASTNCPNEEYRIIYLTTPRYNFYHDLAVCQDNAGFYLCQKYITSSEDVDLNTFEAELAAFNKAHKDEEKNEINEIERGLIDFIKEYKTPIIVISTIIVMAGVVTIVLVIKKRRSRLL